MKVFRLFISGVCLLLLAGGVALAESDVTGKWLLTVSLGDGQGGDATFDLKQEGEKITGTYSGAVGEAEVTGMVKGDEVEFSFESQAGKVSYKGKVSGETMEGTCDYGQFGSGTFKGEKQGQ